MVVDGFLSPGAFYLFQLENWLIKVSTPNFHLDLDFIL